MQKKQILVLSLLVFAISIVLIFMCYLLIQPQDSQNILSLSSKNPTLASTLVLKIGQKKIPGPTPAGTSDPANALDLASPEVDEAPDSNPVDPTGLEDVPTLPADAPTAENTPMWGTPTGGDASDFYTDPESAYPVYQYEDEPGPEPADSETGWSEPPPTDEPIDPPPAEETPFEPEPTEPAAQPTAVSQSTPAPGKTPTKPAPTQAGPTRTPNPARPTASPSPKPAQPSPTASGSAFKGLVSVKVEDAPKLDGNQNDPAWASAPAVTLATSGGANHSATRVSIQSVYDGKRVYFLLTWADPSLSFLRNPWEKLPDGGWKKLIGPKNEGGDESRYYEDKIALFWPVKNNQDDFASRGCGGACHSGENSGAKAYGNMYTAESGQVNDLWQWKSVSSVGQMDDQYLDSSHYSSDNPSAGFHSDPKDGGGYRSNQSDDKKGPAYMPPKGGDRTGAPGYILESEKKELASELFKPGDRVPSILTEPFEGDRGDISARWSYKNGAWILEISRRLETGSKYDVQFDDLDETYSFALASFDNTQIRHAVQKTGTAFRFRK